MKKLLMVSVVTIMSLTLCAKQIPDKVFQYVNEGFPGKEILVYDVKVNIELTLDDANTVITFYPNGDWKEVELKDKKQGEIPTTAVPEEMVKVIEKQFPGVRVVEMEHNCVTGKYEIELDNETELVFNKDKRLIEINN